MSSYTYLLLSHPSLTSPDPLGICEDGVDVVDHFTLLQALLSTVSDAFESLEESAQLQQSSTAQGFRADWYRVLVSLLKDIAYSLHGDDNLLTTGLEAFLIDSSNMSIQTLTRSRKALFDHALRLESVYAIGILEQLCDDRALIEFEPGQVDTILAHMLLGTLHIPAGNTWGRPGFCELYSHSGNIAHAYLRTLFEHFAGGGYSASPVFSPVTFSLHDATSIPDIATSEVPALPFPIRTVDEISEDASSEQNEGRSVLVAAHSQPGPGPHGTQEERHVGQSPALALMSVLKPILLADEVVVTSGLWTHSSWSGHGRRARMTRLFDPNDRSLTSYIVADALELDVVESEPGGLPDLQRGHVEREVRKLYAAFRGAKDRWLKEGGSSHLKIELPAWGCGAFGGNLSIKLRCMRMATALAELESRNFELVVTGDRAMELEDVSCENMVVKDMYARLLGDVF